MAEDSLNSDTSRASYSTANEDSKLSESKMFTSKDLDGGSALHLFQAFIQAQWMLPTSQ